MHINAFLYIMTKISTLDTEQEMDNYSTCILDMRGRYTFKNSRENLR